MKTLKTIKLRLHRETLRHLGHHDLAAVGGARSIVCSQIGPNCGTGGTGGGGTTPLTCDAACSAYCETGGACTLGFTCGAC